MPTLEWLKTEFSYGYSTGNVLSLIPQIRRQYALGGSYRKVFKRAVLPYLRPDARVLELGPGRGSWTRALLRYLPRGELRTVDFQDVTQWIKPEQYGGRLICYRVKDFQLDVIPDGYMDFCWSFGVLCHHSQSQIAEVLRQTLSKMKPGAYAAHQYGDWDKLETFGWERGWIPLNFKNLPDDEIWWPRNSSSAMNRVAQAAGWNVVTPDLNLLGRDSIIVLQCPPER